MHFGRYVADVALDVPDAFPFATLMAEKDNIVGITLRIVSTDNIKQSGLPCSILAIQCPVLTLHHCEGKILQNSTFTIMNIHLIKRNNRRRLLPLY